MEYLVVLVSLTILGLARYTSLLDKPKRGIRRWLVQVSKTREDSGFKAVIKGHYIDLAPGNQLVTIEAPNEYPGSLILKPAPGLFGDVAPQDENQLTPLETGDPVFDGNFMIWGQPEVIGLLNTRVRATIMRLGLEGSTPTYVERLYGSDRPQNFSSRSVQTTVATRNKLSLVEIRGNEIVLRWQRRAR